MATTDTSTAGAGNPLKTLWGWIAYPWRQWFKPWWDGQRDRHLVILRSLFYLSVAATLEAFIFLLFFFSGMDQNDSTESMIITTHWFLLAFGMVGAFLVGPEWWHYEKNWGELRRMLKMTVRSELRKDRREAEDIAELLGTWAQDRLSAHLEALGIIKAGRGRTAKGASGRTASSGKGASASAAASTKLPRSMPAEVAPADDDTSDSEE